MDSGTELRVIKPEGHLHDVDETRLNLKRLRGLSWSLMGDEVAGDDGGGGGNAGSEGRGTEAGAGGETSQGVTEFDFVSAVFELGLRHASPKIVMMLINAPAGTELTTEHIKSHLQKFRQHYARSPSEFVSYVDSTLRPQYERFIKGNSAEAVLAQSYHSKVHAKRSRHESSGIAMLAHALHNHEKGQASQSAFFESSAASLGQHAGSSGAPVAATASADAHQPDHLSVSNGNGRAYRGDASRSVGTLDVSLSSEDGGGKSNDGVIATDDLLMTAVEGSTGSSSSTATNLPVMAQSKAQTVTTSGADAELAVYHRIIEAILENEDELASLQAKEAELVHQHLEIQAKLQRYSQAQLRPQQGGDSRKFQGYLRGYPASGTRGNVLPNSGSGSGGITLGAINLEHASSGHHHGGRGGGGGGNGGGGVGLVESAPSAPLMAGGAEDLDRSLGGSLGWGISHPLRAMTGQPASASQQQPYSGAPRGQPPHPPPRYDYPAEHGRPPPGRFQQRHLSQHRFQQRHLSQDHFQQRHLSQEKASPERATQDRLPRTASAHALAAVTAAAAIVARGLDDSSSSQQSDHAPSLLPPQPTRPPYYSHTQPQPQPQQQPYYPPRHPSPQRGYSHYPIQSLDLMYSSTKQPHAQHQQQHRQMPESTGQAVEASGSNYAQNQPAGPPPQLPKTHESPIGTHPLGNLEDAAATILKIQHI